jgi:uncharacterized protein (TIGR03435 family)
MSARLGALLFLVMGYTIAGAQAPATPAPVFEVASVKRNLSGRVGGAIEIPPAGTIRFTNTTLRILIRNAYQLDAYTEQYTLIPGPYASFIGSAPGDVPHFDVQGKPPDNTKPADRRAMLRALLEDRFKLRVHRETRRMPVYALTVVREGRLGPNLRPSKFNCQAYLAQRRAGGSAPEPVDANGNGWCLYPGYVDTSRTVSNQRFAGPVSLLMQRVQFSVDRPIVDSTGLSGNLEWVLTFGWGADPPADVPSIFTALQDQLGLKLEARQAPVEVLVIDSVELPAPD